MASVWNPTMLEEGTRPGHTGGPGLTRAAARRRSRGVAGDREKLRVAEALIEVEILLALSRQQDRPDDEYRSEERRLNRTLHRVWRLRLSEKIISYGSFSGLYRILDDRPAFKKAVRDVFAGGSRKQAAKDIVNAFRSDFDAYVGR